MSDSGGTQTRRARRARRARCAGWLACLAALGGCASQPVKAPARLAIVELPSTVGDAALREVLHAKREPTGEAVLAADRARIESELDAAVRGDPGCTSPGSAAAGVVVRTPAPAALGQPPDAAALAALNALAPADAFLRLRITDFGTTPRRWRTAYVTFEVVTTLGVTAVLAIKHATRPLAAAYLIEESVEEVSEGFAGFWMLNRLSRPVRIEADLIEAGSGRVLWHGARTGMARWRWQNLRHMDGARRDALIVTSTCRAVDAVLRAVGSAPPAAPCVHCSNHHNG